jgi:methylglutaconyl-CoA hydratase
VSDLVRVVRDSGVVRISLDRPSARNALSAELAAQLTAAFDDEARRDDVRLVILAGEGPDFCAGADLNEMKESGAASRDDNLRGAKQLAAMFRAVRSFPRPVVARVQGNVFGGGVGLVCACDIAVVARKTRFAFSEVRLGILPAIISPYVVRRIGEATARRLFLTGERFGAEEALGMGLASVVVEPEDLDDAIAGLQTDLLAGSPDAQHRIKRLLDAISTGTMDEAAARTPEFIADARASLDGQEGLRAFLEKRRPSWVPPEAS